MRYSARQGTLGGKSREKRCALLKVAALHRVPGRVAICRENLSTLLSKEMC